jgi:hypothetical protein
MLSCLRQPNVRSSSPFQKRKRKTSTSAASVIANQLPIELKIEEIVLKRAYASATASLIPPSTLIVVSNTLILVKKQAKGSYTAD